MLLLALDGQCLRNLPSSPEDAIRARKMVRSFTNTPIAESARTALISALLSAPSAGNTRSLEVLILEGADVATYWDTTLPTSRRPQFPWPRLLAAPLLLVPYVRPGAYVERYGEPDKAATGLGDGADAWGVPYWWVDGGAAVENVLLLVKSFGLGACFFGQFDNEPVIRRQFGVPDDYRAVGTIAVGHPDGNDRTSQSAKRERPPVSEIVHWGSW